MKEYALILMLILAGCQNQKQFILPPVPDLLKEPCEELQEIPLETTQLSQVLTVVSKNYAKYHECRAKVEAWNSFYTQYQSTLK